MGFVYAGLGNDSKTIKIGRTKSTVEKRRAQHKTSDPAFEIYRSFETSYPCAAEKFLKRRFAEKRVPHSKEWFAISKEEVDNGFLALDIFMQTHLSIVQEKEVKRLAKERSDGVFLAPEQDHIALFERLRRLKSEIDERELEWDHLTDQLKLEIGTHDGIDGLFQWISESRQRINQEKLKREFPEVWITCREESFVRKFLLID